MNLSDYLFDHLRDMGVRHIFGVVGGGAMYLNDALATRDDMVYVPCLTEQTAGYAACAYTQYGKMGCCLVTTGPGSTNALTALATAWYEKLPVIFVAAQWKSTELADGMLRTRGVQQVHMREAVESWGAFRRIYTSHDVDGLILYPRMPLWIEVPFDIQSEAVYESIAGD
jgi:acetolactate synthase-1/2/3 large subunit